jgi:hypothetical protein
MAKYDPDRIAETAEPYAPGTSGIEPLCDGFGRLVAAPVVGGGGGGDATAANQVLGLTALDSIYDALQLVGTEATSADILAAVNSLGDGATLADLATALAPLATEATQADILAALEAQAIDVGLIQTNVALLVPDLDDVRIATQATAAATGTTSDADTASTIVGLLKKAKSLLAAGLPASLTSNGGLKTGLVDAIPAGANTIGAVAGSGNFATTNAVSSQADGHSANIGALADADTANTLTGLLKWLKGRWPTALGTGGGLKIDGSGTALPISGNVAASVAAGPGATTAATSVSVTPNTTSFIAAGAPTAAEKATIKASAGRLIGFRVRGASAGTYYLQIHDIASTGSVAGSTQRGLGFEIAGAGDDYTYTFPSPISLSTGITWALSTAIDSYTAATGKTAYVNATWE